MILGVDASNIRAGGGITHLVELLAAAEPARYGFNTVVIWASAATLSLLEERPWLAKRSDPILEKHYLHRALWQRNRLGELAKKEGCNLLFIPGGSFATDFRPVVTMSQNLLPFEWKELSRYGVSLTTFRLILLRWTQSHSFRKASGTIFLTRYAQDVVLKVTETLQGKVAIIPHGIEKRFLNRPRTHRPLAECGEANPIRLVYVSIINVYKHQWRVAEAVVKLRAEGLPVVLDLIGPAYPTALRKLREVLLRVDPTGSFIRYCGAIPYKKLHSHYAEADLCIFASSCENMPNTLLEGMASGLPIACSQRGPMPEILGDAGVYFNPEDPASIFDAIRKLIESPVLRTEMAQAAYERAQEYSWKRCADQTFGFFAEVADGHFGLSGQ